MKRTPDLLQLREALEVSWDEKTSYLAVLEDGNPALGQCYPTSRTVQFYFPEFEVVKGKIWTGKALESHFWNMVEVNGVQYFIDLTWQQFPAGSQVREFRIIDRNDYGDGPDTTRRVELLRRRVHNYLKKPPKQI